MPDGRSEVDRDIAKFETPGRTVPEWPLFGGSRLCSWLNRQIKAAPLDGITDFIK